MSEGKKTFEAIKECLTDYTSPIIVIGPFDLKEENAVILSAKDKKENLIITNDKPLWLKKIESKKSGLNLLIIKDFDKVGERKQNLFKDIICYNRVSSMPLPKNLRIIVNLNKKSQINPDILEFCQIFEIGK